MSKIVLNHHASCILAKCEETGEFLFGKYDPGYPGKNKHWIGRVKLIGGNYFFGKDSDVSPLETVRREVGEEFSGKKAAEGEMAASQKHLFASAEDIQTVSRALLNMESFQDYFLHQPGPSDKPPIYVIQSVYRTLIPKNVIEIAKENISQDKSLTNEGFLEVTTLDNLLKGNPMTQGITGLIIGHAEGLTMPHCLQDLFICAPIGKPRDSYKAYLNNFEYRDHSNK